jgi:hypothetical protein
MMTTLARGGSQRRLVRAASKAASPSLRTAVRALPNCHLRLKAPIPKLTPYFLKRTRYPTTLDGVGHHLRKRRLELGLLQDQVADQLGANPSTYRCWENLVATPGKNVRANVVGFLGYDPFNGS